MLIMYQWYVCHCEYGVFTCSSRINGMFVTVNVIAANTTDPNMPMMMMETRQQNTEVRVSLSKISDKVDRISDRVSVLVVVSTV